MKKTTRIVLIVAILISSLACNLSQYMSDTPPVEWVSPTNEPETARVEIDLRNHVFQQKYYQHHTKNIRVKKQVLKILMTISTKSSGIFFKMHN